MRDKADPDAAMDGRRTTTIVNAPDGGATARPDLLPATWRKLWGANLAALLLVTVALAFLLRSTAGRIATVAVVASPSAGCNASPRRKI
ncbi:MAG TPA: hypothetical protein VIM44_01620 [Rariglobus sp.]